MTTHEASSGERPSSQLVAIGIAVAVLPFAVAPALTWATGDAADIWNQYVIPLLAPALAAVMIRVVGSWRRWAWVGASVTVAAVGYATFAWLRLNPSCTEAGPALTALAVGASVLIGSAVGALVVGPSGPAWRSFAGAALGFVVAGALAAASMFLMATAGIPSLIVFASHC